MNEAEAHELAVEIGCYPGWWAYAKEQLAPPNRDNHDWWVQAHHVSMDSRATSANPYPIASLASRDEWSAARAKWS